MPLPCPPLAPSPFPASHSGLLLISKYAKHSPKWERALFWNVLTHISANVLAAALAQVLPYQRCLSDQTVEVSLLSTDALSLLLLLRTDPI